MCHFSYNVKSLAGQQHIQRMVKPFAAAGDRYVKVILLPTRRRRPYVCRVVCDVSPSPGSAPESRRSMISLPKSGLGRFASHCRPRVTADIYCAGIALPFTYRIRTFSQTYQQPLFGGIGVNPLRLGGPFDTAAAWTAKTSHHGHHSLSSRAIASHGSTAYGAEQRSILDHRACEDFRHQ